MKGQTYDSKPLHQHLIINEDEATEYTNETAKYMVSLMQAIKERGITSSKTKHPTKQHSHLITYSLNKGIKKFKTFQEFQKKTRNLRNFINFKKTKNIFFRNFKNKTNIW